MARYGLAIGSVTEERASVGVVWAARFPTSHGAPRWTCSARATRDRTWPLPSDRFTPGHTKWDYGHSIRELRPDLIAQVWPPSRRDFNAVAATAGYESWLLRAARKTPETLSVLSGGRVFVRADSRLVRRNRLTPYRPAAS